MRHDKIIFLISSLLRTECQRTNSCGPEILRQLVHEIFESISHILTLDTPEEVYASSSSARLFVASHLYVLLITDAVPQSIAAGEASGIFARFCQVVEHASKLLFSHREFSTIGQRAAKIAVPTWLSACLLCIDGYERLTMIEGCSRAIRQYSSQLIGVESAARWEFQPGSRPAVLFGLMDRAWQRLPAGPSAVTEREFIRGARSSQILIDGFQCTIDFSSMILLNTVTNERITVRRVLSRSAQAAGSASANPVAQDVPISGLSEDNQNMVVSSCARFLHAQVDQSTLNALLRVSVRLSRNESVASTFFTAGGLGAVLNIRTSSCFQGLSLVFSVCMSNTFLIFLS